MLLQLVKEDEASSPTLLLILSTDGLSDILPLFAIFFQHIYEGFMFSMTPTAMHGPRLPIFLHEVVRGVSMDVLPDGGGAAAVFILDLMLYPRLLGASPLSPHLPPQGIFGQLSFLN